MFIVSLSLLKSDRQLNSPVYHNTVHCTLHGAHCTTVQAGLCMGRSQVSGHIIRPSSKRCLLQFFYCLPPQIQAFYCCFYRGRGVLWKIWQNICKTARTLFMLIIFIFEEWKLWKLKHEIENSVRHKTMLMGF